MQSESSVIIKNEEVDDLRIDSEIESTHHNCNNHHNNSNPFRQYYNQVQQEQVLMSVMPFLVHHQNYRLHHHHQQQRQSTMEHHQRPVDQVSRPTNFSIDSILNWTRNSRNNQTMGNESSQPSLEMTQREAIFYTWLQRYSQRGWF